MSAADSAAPEARSHPGLGRLEDKGWEPIIRPIPGLGSDLSVFQPLRSETFGLVAVVLNVDRADRIEPLLHTVVAATPLQVNLASGVRIYAFRFDGEPLKGQTWHLKAGGSIMVLWDHYHVPLWPDADKGQWLRHPAAFGPDDVPHASEDDLTAFVDAAHALSPIETYSAGQAPPAPPGKVFLSPVGKLGVPWKVDIEGNVISGIRYWAKSVARHHAAFGGSTAAEVVCKNALENVTARLRDGASIQMVADIERWVEEGVSEALMARSMAGYRPLAPRPSVSHTSIEVSPYEPEWLVDACPPDVRSDVATVLGVEADGVYGFDEIGLDRNLLKQELRDVVLHAIDGFAKDVSSRVPRARLLVVPPGVGKTTTTLSQLLFGHEDDALGRIQGPIGFLAPNYENIAEIRDRIERSGAHIVWLPTADPALLETARNPNSIKVMTFAGRIHAGCAIPEKMELASAIGQGASLCHARNDDGDDIFCPHYQTCPAILQRKQAGLSDLILMPHQYLVSSIPPELKVIKGLVIDERTDSLFMNTVTVPLDEVSVPRRRIKTTKAMRGEGVTAEDLMAAREDAWKIIAQAIKSGTDPVFLASTDARAAHAFKSAWRYCAALGSRDIHITPHTPLEALQAAADRPVGKHLSEEIRFWEILADDIEAKRLGTFRVKWIKLADGRDAIRISWRETPNWTDIPKLLLDGSASIDVVRKLWPRSSENAADGTPLLVEHRSVDAEIKVNALLPTILIQSPETAKSSILPYQDAGQEAVLKAARTLERIRRVITAVAGRNGDGRVLVGSMKAINAVVQDGWCPPANVDFCHYGALRGLNQFERHKVALSIGRLELPPEVTEGLACALGYDDPMWPGVDPEQSGIVPVPLIMRDGRRFSIPSPAASDNWSRAVQTVSREEELRQFAGRLRAVQRVDGAYPDIAWLVMGNVVPENTVLDSAITDEDLINDRFLPLFEIARRTGGVIPTQSAIGWLDDHQITQEFLSSLIDQFGRNRSALRHWRAMDVEFQGIRQRVYAARFLSREDLHQALQSVDSADPWSICVAYGGTMPRIALADEIDHMGMVLTAVDHDKESPIQPGLLSFGGLPAFVGWVPGDGGRTPLTVAAAAGAIVKHQAKQKAA